jgi:hypothetical protein
MNDRIEEAAKAIGKVCFPATPWGELWPSSQATLREMARAASAVLCDEGLRKAAEEVWEQAEATHAYPKLMWFIERLKAAALTRQDGPSQSTNYVSAPHDDPKMKCESCGTEQWPQCPSCGALLIEKPESTQEPPSQPVKSQCEIGVNMDPCVHGPKGYISTYCLHGFHGECRMSCKVCGMKCHCARRHEEPPSQQEAVNYLSEDRGYRMRCQSCQTESPCPSCGTCGALLIDVIDNDSPEVLATVTYNPGSGKVTEKLHMARPASSLPQRT